MLKSGEFYVFVPQAMQLKRIREIATVTKQIDNSENFPSEFQRSVEVICKFPTCLNIVLILLKSPKLAIDIKSMFEFKFACDIEDNLSCHSNHSEVIRDKGEKAMQNKKLAKYSMQ
jgi:hypothetical protein